MDAGHLPRRNRSPPLIEHNNILDNSVGVYIHGSAESMVRENKIVGDSTLRVNERGNAVTVWNAPGAQVIGNDISKGRDGIFSQHQQKQHLQNNRFSDLRFAVHYMYTNDSEVSDNISVGNNMGLCLDVSPTASKYTATSPSAAATKASCSNYVNYSEINDKIINKAGKVRFCAYNANYNKIIANYFENCEIGIHFTAAIEGTSLSDNAFINNESQVKLPVSTRFLDWGEGGTRQLLERQQRFDLDGDGLATAHTVRQRHHPTESSGAPCCPPPDEQPRHQHRQMGAIVIPRHPSRRRDR